ncbi:MAG: C-GCAxxG-C-C family protein [Lachnospiraceae bacterium]|nr:C-GCAxxG-C-C family protein [Lachnospiraceae bacterium]
MNAYEEKARNNHRSFMNCSKSVYSVFNKVNLNYSKPPAPRSEDGKCGAVLAAEHIIRETGKGSIEAFDREFADLYGSLKCSDLRGAATGQCNDYVGAAARIASQIIGVE